MVAAQGFCGIRFRPEGLVVEPRLPEKWKSASLRVVFRGYVLKLTITHSSCRMEVDGSRAQGPAQVVLNGEAHALADKLKFAH
jgi:maltose phosphorylase